ncbi:hypothetical protein B0H15DRAFT_958137 [Mycena belliarum]|uniref:Uncharacterized protein n=1 Tax=Mycena belliarum TaxID=1033014 RepID=A0AAD6XDQ6_9AGAR|nr:hypothetical protein B0H15DRAFT_958137 [Mycena belliae]
MAATTLDNVELAAQRLEFELAAQEPKTLFPAFFVQLRRVLGIAFEQWLRACLLSPLPQLHEWLPTGRRGSRDCCKSVELAVFTARASAEGIPTRQIHTFIRTRSRALCANRRIIPPDLRPALVKLYDFEAPFDSVVFGVAVRLPAACAQARARAKLRPKLILHK